MKRKEFIKGKIGYIYSMSSLNAPKDAYIEEVEVEEYEGDGWGSVWNYPNEMSEEVEIKDVYNTYEEAEKALIKFLLKTLTEYTVENEI